MRFWLAAGVWVCLLALAACSPGAGSSTTSAPLPIAQIRATTDLQGDSSNYDVLSDSTGVWIHNFDIGDILRVDPQSSKVVATIPLTPGAGRQESDGGILWVVSHDDSSSTLWKIDENTNKIVGTTSLSYPNTFMALSPGAIWLGSIGTAQITRIDSQTNQVVATISIADAPGWLSYGAGSLWACGAKIGSILRIDPSTNQVVKRIDVGSNQDHHCDTILARDNVVWASISTNSDRSGTMIYRVDPATNTLSAPTTMPEPFGNGLAFDGKQLWGYSILHLFRLDAQTGQVTGSLGVKYANGIGAGYGSVWVTTDDPAGSATLYRFTPAS
jgi:streptogramin lyase